MVSITCPSLQILSKPQTGVFPIPGFLVNPLENKNWYNSRTSDDIDMKLGPITRIDKRNKTTLKKITMTSYREIVTSLSFFGFLAHLEQSGDQIPGTESAKVMFSAIVTFRLTKTENRTKKTLTQLWHYCFQ